MELDEFLVNDKITGSYQTTPKHYSTRYKQQK